MKVGKRIVIEFEKQKRMEDLTGDEVASIFFYQRLVSSLVFCARDCLLRAAGQGHREAADHPCFYRHDVLAHVYRQMLVCMNVILLYPCSIPLQIIWPRILVLSVRTERAHVTWRLMDKAMTYHFILAFETLTAF